MKQYVPIEFDLNGKVSGISQLHIAAWAFFPKERVRGVLFCQSPGTYTKAYFHLIVPGYPHKTFSFATFMARQGWIVIAVDCPGSVESTSPVSCGLTMEKIAQIDDAVVRQINYRLLTGTLHQDMAMFLHPPIIIGLGHAMGAMLSITQQALYDTFDALVVVDWSNTQPKFREAYALHARIARLKEQRDEESWHVSASLLSQEARELMCPDLYAPGVSQKIRVADEAQVTSIPYNLLLDENAPLRVEKLASEIDVPVFVAHGGNADEVMLEMNTYSSRAHVTPYLLPDSSLCQNYVPTRETLWQSIHVWGDHVVGNGIDLAS